MPPKALDDFHSHLQEAIASRQMVKLTLSKTRKKNDSPKRVSIKPVALKAGLRYSFLYSYPTRDEVKNHLPEETVLKVEQLLEEYFLEANLFTISAQQSLILSAKGKGKLLSKKNEQTAEIKLSHDRSKNRLLDAAGLHWHLLGMTDTKGNVQASMQHKFKQINKYIEILDGLISPWLSEGPVKVVDMGAGKGYLTFALYEHLQAKNTLQPQVIGVEQRPELVVKTNAIAKNANMEGLTFEEGSIHNYPLKEVEILIALHACDTATDNAIAAGIAAGARLIVCAPCCHKQLRKEMKASAPKLPMLQYGILFERQAEILTDTLRALIMEKYGYKTHIQEFIEAEHTPKNVLLSGFKTENKPQKDKIEEQIEQLKREFGIKEHFLETALRQKGL